MSAREGFGVVVGVNVGVGVDVGVHVGECSRRGRGYVVVNNHVEVVVMSW